MRQCNLLSMCATDDEVAVVLHGPADRHREPLADSHVAHFVIAIRKFPLHIRSSVQHDQLSGRSRQVGSTAKLPSLH